MRCFLALGRPEVSTDWGLVRGEIFPAGNDADDDERHVFPGADAQAFQGILEGLVAAPIANLLSPLASYSMVDGGKQEKRA